MLEKREIIRYNSQGIEINNKCNSPHESRVINNCENNFIPGLDADYCEDCKTFFRDEKMTRYLLNKRKNIKDLNS